MHRLCGYYQLTRLTFGVSASPFAMNMAMRENALDHQRKYSLATQAVMDPLYMDNGSDGADSFDEAIKPWAEMQELFEFGGFVLQKWKSSETAVITQIPQKPVDRQSTQSIDIDHFTKVLGME